MPLRFERPDLAGYLPSQRRQHRGDGGREGTSHVTVRARLTRNTLASRHIGECLLRRIPGSIAKVRRATRAMTG
jgi:hypothetical protein